jgi:hypothetical protein
LKKPQAKSRELLATSTTTIMGTPPKNANTSLRNWGCFQKRKNKPERRFPAIVTHGLLQAVANSQLFFKSKTGLLSPFSKNSLSCLGYPFDLVVLIERENIRAVCHTGYSKAVNGTAFSAKTFQKKVTIGYTITKCSSIVYRNNIRIGTNCLKTWDFAKKWLNLFLN